MTDFIWAKGFGSSGGDSGNGITTDSSGNVYTTGSFQNTATFGSTTLTSQGSADIFVAKQDSSGNLAWAKSFGGTSSDVGNSIVTDSSGNLYITGNFAGTATFGSVTLTSQGQADMFIAKLDSSGNVVWAKSWGGGGSDRSNRIAIDSSGNLYTTGEFNNKAIFGNTTLTSQGNIDVFVTKLDSNGNLTWAKSLGGTKQELSRGITTDSNGNVYVTGSFQENATFGSTTLTSQGSNDIFFTKLDSSGNVTWAKSFGSSGNDVSGAITTDSKGNLFLTGGFAGTTTFGSVTLTPLGNSEMFVTKLDINGNVTAVQNLVMSNDGAGIGITTDINGNVYTTGFFNGILGLGNNSWTSQGSNDIFVAKLDNGLGITSLNAMGGTGNDLGRDIATIGGNVYTTGFFPNTASFGNIPLTSQGINDIFVAKQGVVYTATISPSFTPSETGPRKGSFLITLNDFAPPGGLTINYSIAGTATLNTDYTIATVPGPTPAITAITPTSFTIASGRNSGSFLVVPVDDALVDPNETIELTLTSGNNYQLGATSSATLTIADNDIPAPPTPNVTITPGTNPSETGSSDGNFIITLDNPAPSGGLTINYSVAGTATNNTDYHLAPGNNIIAATAKSFTIAAGQTTATLNVTPVDDAVVDPNETVQLTLEKGTNYNVGAANNATLTIADDVRVVSIAPGTNANERGSINGTFIVTLDNPAPAGGLTITYKVAGTATETTDFTLTPGSNITDVRPKTFTIAAGQTTATLNVTPVDDTVFDPGETVQLTLEKGSSNYSLGATTQASITIADNTPTVNIASQNFASERGQANGTFVVTLDSPAPTGGLTVNYGVGGNATLTTDYTLTQGNNISAVTANSFTIAAGQTTATLNVIAVADNVFDPGEVVQLTLNSGNNYNLGADKSASIAIADQADCFCDYVTPPELDKLSGVLVDLYPANNFLYGDDNNSAVVGTALNDEIFTFGGNDFVLGKGGNDNLIDGKGNSNLYGGPDDDWIAGGEGDDFLNGNEGEDYVNGNQGNDTIRGGQNLDFLRGGQGNDIIYGDKGNDILAGDKGDDTIFGGGAADLSGSTDDDVIFGGEGNDLLYGNTGIDFIFGEDGNDTIRGGQGQDYLFGEAGNDLVFGDLGNDFICGDDGNDTLFGGNGTDVSDSDIDEICGGKGDDLIFGNQGGDWLNGELGNDSLYGGKGDDTLIGGDGNDLLSGDTGNDLLTGGNGNDQFVLASGKGSDVIVDFQDGVDFLALSGGLTFAQLAFAQSGNNTVITRLGSNELLATLNGIAANLITQADFVSLP